MLIQKYIFEDNLKKVMKTNIMTLCYFKIYEDNTYFSCLEYAVKCGRLSIVDYFSDIGLFSKDAMTIAIQYNRLLIVKYFLDNGYFKYSRNLYELAKQWNHYEIIEYFDDIYEN